MQRLAVLGSGVIATGMLVPLSAFAYWLVPLVFGSGYRGAVPLLWILTPGPFSSLAGGLMSDLLRGRNRPIVVAWAQGLAAVLRLCFCSPCCRSSVLGAAIA